MNVILLRYLAGESGSVSDERSSATLTHLVSVTDSRSTHRQTDRQTDRQTECPYSTALQRLRHALRVAVKMLVGLEWIT